jgi:hypothetical protein
VEEVEETDEDLLFRFFLLTVSSFLFEIGCGFFFSNCVTGWSIGLGKIVATGFWMMEEGIATETVGFGFGMEES